MSFVRTVRLPASQLMPGDRFASKGKTWVVLARMEAPSIASGALPDVQLRVIDTTTVKSTPVSVTPPDDLLVEVFNRDDSITAEQAVQNLKDGGLL